MQVPGEICIGGKGLARGYLGRPALTAEKFVPDPFSRIPGARIYRTGDLGRYRTDRAIEYLGRMDQQVKLRGFRIELGEVESVLLSHPLVSEAVVTVQEDGFADRTLVAHIVLSEPSSEDRPGSLEIKGYLRGKLPEYMVPSHIVELQKMPLTPNGKLDRKLLPKWVPQGIEERARPQTVTEELLAQIWADVLRFSPVGVDDNFFEMGGHSLLATQLISRIREVFHAEIKVRTLFESPTIARLARLIDLQGGAEDEAPELKPIPRVARDLLPSEESPSPLALG